MSNKTSTKRKWLAPKEITVQVPPELRRMAIDVALMQGYCSSDPEKVLMKALRVGLAHLLVLEEESARWRMNQM